MIDKEKMTWVANQNEVEIKWVILKDKDYFGVIIYPLVKFRDNTVFYGNGILHGDNKKHDKKLIDHLIFDIRVYCYKNIKESNGEGLIIPYKKFEDSLIEECEKQDVVI